MLAVITTGPAAAPIDDVRHISNFATGEIGALLAEALAAHGFEPLLFRARGATHTTVPRGALLHEFNTNHDLTRTLRNLSATRGPDILAVFHAAALSDYAVASVREPDGAPIDARKIPGDLPQLHLVLEPAPKILPHLHDWFPHAWIAGWKYELEASREDAIEAARAQLASNHTNATIINGAAYGPGFGLLEDAQPPVHFADKRELAQFLASRAATFAKSHK
jgi:phosphopantothenoylcysteine synthetase/decarboxylase